MRSGRRIDLRAIVSLLQSVVSPLGRPPLFAFLCVITYICGFRPTHTLTSVRCGLDSRRMSRKRRFWLGIPGLPLGDGTDRCREANQGGESAEKRIASDYGAVIPDSEFA